MESIASGLRKLLSGILLLPFALIMIIGDLPASEFDGEVILVLEHALVQNYRGGAGRGSPLIVHAVRENGRWKEVWAEACTFNSCLHEVEIKNSRIDGDHLELELAVTILKDIWVQGGQAQYQVKVERKPNNGFYISNHVRLNTKIASALYGGSYKGYYQSPWAKYGSESKVEGIFIPAVKGFVLNEETMSYPRLLLRKSDIPGIRARQETPLGRRVTEHLQQSPHEIALALMYALTQNQEYAEKALERVKKQPGQALPNTIGYGGITLEHTSFYKCEHLSSVGFVYDLCHLAWSASDAKSVEDYLSEKCWFNKTKPWGYSNVGVCNPQNAGIPIYSSLAARL